MGEEGLRTNSPLASRRPSMNWARVTSNNRKHGRRTEAASAGGRRRLFGAVYLARSPSLLPASWNAWLWRPHRARRLHAARPGGKPPLGLEARLLGRSGIFAVISRSVGGAASDVFGLASCRSRWGNASGHNVHLAVLPDGARIGRSLCSLRQPALDSRHVLRDWGGGHCDHCKKRNQTGPHYGRERLAPLGNLWVDRANHSVDQI